MFGSVAPNPMFSRLISALAEARPKALRLIRGARAATREHVRKAVSEAAPGAGNALIPLDLDETIVIAHSDKEQAASTWENTLVPAVVFARRPQPGMYRRAGRGRFSAKQHRLQHRR